MKYAQGGTQLLRVLHRREKAHNKSKGKINFWGRLKGGFMPTKYTKTRKNCYK